MAFGAFLAGTQIQGLLVLNYPWYVYHAWPGTLLVIAILIVATLFNTYLAKQLALVEGCVLVIHIVGFFCILIPLWVTSKLTTSHEVWTTFYDPGWGNQGLSTLVGIVASVAPLLGADAAGEKCTKRPCDVLVLMNEQHTWLKSSKMPRIRFRG